MCDSVKEGIESVQISLRRKKKNVGAYPRPVTEVTPRTLHTKNNQGRENEQNKQDRIVRKIKKLLYQETEKYILGKIS